MSFTFSPESLVEKACERHGGVEAYSSLGPIRLRVKMSGFASRIKGLDFTFPPPDAIVVDPNELTAEFRHDTNVIVYDNGEIISNGVLMPRYRATFNGLRKIRCWSPEDACYFFGYALVGYFGFPFSLKGLELHQCGKSPNGLSWVEAVFPHGADTHCQKQRFWFDESGLLVRHDYCADIVGRIFSCAHFSGDYCFDYAVPLAKSRVVNLRLGRWALSLPILNAELSFESVG